MKIIVPLAGSNSEFISSYGTIKPLTKVGNDLLLNKFINSFRFSYEYIFICNLKDLLSTDLLEIINKLKKHCFRFSYVKSVSLIQR